MLNLIILIKNIENNRIYVNININYNKITNA